jgi:hypothetical protein
MTQDEIDLAIHQRKLRPFTTDGCSDCGLSRVFGLLHKDIPAQLHTACVEHDKDYWLGKASGITRAEADEKFRKAIVACGHQRIAALYWAGVRMGGAGWLPTPWRWGYGWVS